jgi:hypothetical protein
MGALHLDPDARIVHDPVFQNAVTKAIYGEALDESESGKLQKFKKSEISSSVSSSSSSSSLTEIARNKKKRKLEQTNLLLGTSI